MKSQFLYYCVILPISMLPFRLLYAVSDFMYIIVYYIVPYRKQIVFNNLRNSFPEKSEKEIRTIAKKFYHHLCDLVLESIKTFTISKKEIQRRSTCKNPEVANKYFKMKKNIIIVGGHYNNWEYYAMAFDLHIDHKACGVYKAISDKFINKVMLKNRRRFGLQLISATNVKRYFEYDHPKPTATILLTDQSPSTIQKKYWTNFLNQDTPILFGAEKYAREYNYPVIFGNINKTKRGYYEIEYFEVASEPQKTKHGEITEAHTRMLEKFILKQPEYWLWSHRRWKHKKENDTDGPIDAIGRAVASPDLG